MKDSVKRNIFLFLLIIYVIMLTIGAVITIPNGAVSSNDKLMHFLEFFGLSLIVVKTLQLYNVKFQYILGFLISCLLALASEGIQLATINRTFSVYDLLSDLIGIIFGLVLFKVVVSKWKF